jgi:hypothetical protein
MTARLAVEAPPNPHVRVFHVREELTREIVAVFGAGAPPWLAPVVAHEGVREASLNRYRIRVSKSRDAEWSALEPVAIAAFESRFGAIGPLPPAPESSARFAPVSGPRRVFEGVSSAAHDPLGRALFEIEGVAEVVFDPLETLVVKGRLFDAALVFGAVARVLSHES